MMVRYLALLSLLAFARNPLRSSHEVDFINKNNTRIVRMVVIGGTRACCRWGLQPYYIYLWVGFVDLRSEAMLGSKLGIQ